ncbi:MAG: adenylosuccinate synthase [candidate division NC10 bacterium]|nr:adenylosuccinate synthase [candidate division NC10 bacterium]
MANVIVVGSQWGDEGKGKIVDTISESFDAVARYQGGNNAGHTVVVGNEKVILHLVPSGILRKGKTCILGNGVVVDLPGLTHELNQLGRLAVKAEGHLYVGKNAHLVLPYHKILDIEREQNTARRIGTTGRGIGPAYADKVARVGIRIGDLLHPGFFRERLRTNVIEKQAHAPKESALHTLDADAIFDEQMAHFREVQAFLVDASAILNRMIDAGKKILFEGAQGTLLDVDLGTYPYVTSSSATAGGACIGTGVAPTRIDGVLGVIKAYTTRVGEGPFPTELSDSTGEELRRRGEEYGATTGRPRRCGWLDAISLAYAIRVNGFSTLALTKLDVLDPFPVLQICRAYRYRDQTLEEFPNETNILKECQPLYEEIEGWQESTVGRTSVAELPKKCRAFLDRLEAILGVDISIISTGPERDQTILLPTRTLKQWGLV